MRSKLGWSAEDHDRENAAPTTKKKPTPTTTNLHCGECAINRAELAKLQNGICPKCGADYRGKP